MYPEIKTMLLALLRGVTTTQHATQFYAGDAVIDEAGIDALRTAIENIPVLSHD